MADALNVNRFDMRVLIFDLEKLREFRKSELTEGANDKLDSSEEIADELVKFDRIQLFPELHQLNVSVIPSIKQNDLISTLIVAELRCARGTVKPAAQQVPNKGTVLSFDLKRIHPGMLNYWNALNHLKCVEFCVFPFIRVGHSTTLINTTLIEEKRKTNLKYIFRARELCELMP
uniref:Uncharacterized protein n=1 Tax=Meloidogyne javanica TaxID=6303 RepID=A0A915LYF2_MELJA